MVKRYQWQSNCCFKLVSKISYNFPTCKIEIQEIDTENSNSYSWWLFPQSLKYAVIFAKQPNKCICVCLYLRIICNMYKHVLWLLYTYIYCYCCWPIFLSSHSWSCESSRLCWNIYLHNMIRFFPSCHCLKINPPFFLSVLLLQPFRSASVL